MAKKRFHMGDMGERDQEARDFTMLSEDKHAIANLPPKSVYREWPKAGDYMMSDLNDTITGIDRQMNADGHGMNRQKAKTKY